MKGKQNIPELEVNFRKSDLFFLSSYEHKILTFFSKLALLAWLAKSGLDGEYKILKNSWKLC